MRPAASIARWRVALAAAAALAASLPGFPLWAQYGAGDGIPSNLYYNALPLYSAGNYRDALVALTNAGGTAIQSGGSRWIDSICYYSMMGESQYQLGQLREALASYDSALKLYVAYSDWMQRVRFPTVILPAAPTTVRQAPWGQSRRHARLGQFPDTMMIGQGQVDQTAVLFNGGVMQPPVLVTIHPAEIVRCTCLAIRRHRELLGPLSKFDPLTNDVLDALSRRPGPPNHWSEAWIDVELGCAFAAAGQVPQAITSLERGLLVSGEFDHPLTSMALVELGRLALEAGNFQAAADYFEEATYASAKFSSPYNLEEAFRLGALAQLLLDPRQPFRPLAPALDWARHDGTEPLRASLWLSTAERFITLADSASTANCLNQARRSMRGDLPASSVGARLKYLTAVDCYQTNNVANGDQALAAALGFERTASPWLFQLQQLDSRYLSGALGDRNALALYELLLRDPAPGDWAASPLDCLALLATPHEQAIEHWFEAALKGGKDADTALEIADRARRYRFYQSVPFGGRLIALRWILEGPTDLLGQRGVLERQNLLARYPRYQQLAAEAARIVETLSTKPAVPQETEARREEAAQLASLALISQKQEVILREMAVRREAAEMVFPPQRRTKDVQGMLPEGQVVLAFFATEQNLYAFLYGRDRYASWHIGSYAQLEKQIANLLRDMGNFDVNHEVSPADLAKNAWRATASKVKNLLFEKSNVDLTGNFDEIVVVPDDIVWYLPFEALPIGKPAHEQPLIASARVRYAPTVGLAVPRARSRKPKPTTAVVLGRLHPQHDEAVAQEAREQFSRSVSRAVVLPRTLPAASSVYRGRFDHLIVLDDVKMDGGPFDWSPAQLDRGKPGSTLADWMALPWGGPESILLPGFHTAAESGLRKEGASGSDLFLSLCGLLANQTRTILISRWRTGGQTSFDLTREFAQELPHVSPAEAWQRSVELLWRTPLEPEKEPRIKKVSTAVESPLADHPFFWAGWLLVDCGMDDVAGVQRPAPIVTPAQNLAPSAAVGRGGP